MRSNPANVCFCTLGLAYQGGEILGSWCFVPNPNPSVELGVIAEGKEK